MNQTIVTNRRLPLRPRRHAFRAQMKTSPKVKSTQTRGGHVRRDAYTWHDFNTSMAFTTPTSHDIDTNKVYSSNLNPHQYISYLIVCVPRNDNSTTYCVDQPCPNIDEGLTCLSTNGFESDGTGETSSLAYSDSDVESLEPSDSIEAAILSSLAVSPDFSSFEKDFR